MASNYLKTKITQGARLFLGKVDVIVVNWNGQDHIKECIDSILDQTYKDINIIVVDNNSSDNSANYVRKNYDQVQLLSLDRNYGFATANNRGIENSTSEFVALLNNDAVVHPNWLSKSIQGLVKHSEAGFCASKIINYYKRNILDTAGDLYTTGGVNEKRGMGEPPDTYNKYEYVFGACAAAVVYRRTMLEDIGLFDEDFFVMTEDVDISFRAQLRGYKCIYCPNAVVYHKVHGTIKNYGKVFSYFGQRNIEFVYFKNLPFRLLVTNLPKHLIYNFIVLIYFTIKGGFFSFIKAKKDI